MTSLYPGNDVVDMFSPSLYATVAPNDTIGHYAAMVATGKPYMLGEFGPGNPPVAGYDQQSNLLAEITHKSPKTVGVMNWWSSYGIQNIALGGAPYMKDSRVLNLGEVNWQAYLRTSMPPTSPPSKHTQP